MKLQIFKLIALLTLFTGVFSCKSDSKNPELDDNKFYWDGYKQEEFRPIYAGTDSSSFVIDNYIISFNVSYLLGNLVGHIIPTPGWGGCLECLSPNFWFITLFMDEGVDVTKLAPVITLAPGSTLILKEYYIGDQVYSDQINLTGISEVGRSDFTKPVCYTLITPDGSTVYYCFLAIANGTERGPCVNCN